MEDYCFGCEMQEHSCLCEHDDEEFEYGVRQPVEWLGDTLGANLEAAASMAAMHRIGYTKGFQAGQLLAEFCEDYIPEPYMPMGDSRPAAERLAWLPLKSTTKNTD